MVEINKNKLIKELKFWNIFCLSSFTLGTILSLCATGALKHIAPFTPVSFILNAPLFLGILFLIPFTMSSDILDKIDDDTPK